MYYLLKMDCVELSFKKGHMTEIMVVKYLFNQGFLFLKKLTTLS